MTTERTLRIDHAMLRRAQDALQECTIFTGSDQGLKMARATLEAALEPYLERRNGDRRTHIAGKDLGNGLYTGPNAGTLSGTTADVPTCAGGIKDAEPLRWHRRCGDISIPHAGMAPCRYHRRNGEQVPYHGYAMHSRHGERGAWTHRRATDPTLPKQEQNNTPEISRAMTQEGLWAFYRDISGEDWKSDARHEEMANAYRAMESQRRKEQGWDGIGPGGA